MAVFEAQVAALWYFSVQMRAQIAREEHTSAIELLSIFAQHLSILSNQIMIQHSNTEAPWIRKAKHFICEQHAETLRFADVAKFVNMSPFYFAKMFKQGTGLTFTGYLTRVRVEHCKHLLLKPDLRVSEIAYEVGFQSVIGGPCQVADRANAAYSGGGHRPPQTGFGEAADLNRMSGAESCFYNGRVRAS